MILFCVLLEVSQISGHHTRRQYTLSYQLAVPFWGGFHSIYWRLVIERNCLHLVAWRCRVNVSSMRKSRISFFKLQNWEKFPSLSANGTKPHRKTLFHKDNSSSKGSNTLSLCYFLIPLSSWTWVAGSPFFFFRVTEARRGVRIPTWDISDGMLVVQNKHVPIWNRELATKNMDVEQNPNKIHQTGISTYMFCMKIKQL